jgi:hypothetical protein
MEGQLRRYEQGRELSRPVRQLQRREGKQAMLSAGAGEGAAPFCPFNCRPLLSQRARYVYGNSNNTELAETVKRFNLN